MFTAPRAHETVARRNTVRMPSQCSGYGMVALATRRATEGPPNGDEAMCRSIRPLFNYDPAATEEDVQASALQYVRKVSGFTKPSQANREAFDEAVAEISAAAQRLLGSLVTSAPLRNREMEIAKARERRAGDFIRAPGNDTPVFPSSTSRG